MTIRKTPTLLVVEDDAENRVAMVKVLQSAEYKVLETDNGQQALDILNEEDIDILVTDLRLPVMDGVELLKRAKAVEQDLEVIMITGHGTVEIHYWPDGKRPRRATGGGTAGVIFRGSIETNGVTNVLRG